MLPVGLNPSTIQYPPLNLSGVSGVSIPPEQINLIDRIVFQNKYNTRKLDTPKKLHANEIKRINDILRINAKRLDISSIDEVTGKFLDQPYKNEKSGSVTLLGQLFMLGEINAIKIFDAAITKNNINKSIDGQWHPLISAILGNQPMEIIEYAIQKEADVNQTEEGFSPLHLCLLMKHQLPEQCQIKNPAQYYDKMYSFLEEKGARLIHDGFLKTLKHQNIKTLVHQCEIGRGGNIEEIFHFEVKMRSALELGQALRAYHKDPIKNNTIFSIFKSIRKEGAEAADFVNSSIQISGDNQTETIFDYACIVFKSIVETGEAKNIKPFFNKIMKGFIFCGAKIEEQSVAAAALVSKEQAANVLLSQYRQTLITYSKNIHSQISKKPPVNFA
jgi:hypothetical protein